MYKYYLSLGTNLGDKEKNLLLSLEKIEKQVGEVFSLSAFYATEPWGFASENGFLNAVCGVVSVHAPIEMLGVTQQIEQEMGRMQKSIDGQYHDRIIDIDILLAYDECEEAILMQEARLTLPHPLMHLRDFVLRPMAEIAPELVHPILKKPIKELITS